MNRYIAEFFGTFALVFCGTGAIITNEMSEGAVGHIGVAITFGLIVIAMIYAIGDISGAHINPAVTIAFAVAGKFPIPEILPFIGAQIFGGVAASIVLYCLFPGSPTLGETFPMGNVWQSFFLEYLLTLILMFVIIQVSTGSKEVGMMAGLAIGCTVLLEAMFAGPISGASMNPARSLGPALVSGNLISVWVYLIAPVFGSVSSVFLWRLTRLSNYN